MSYTTPPSPDEIEVNLFGPGFGECLVIHLGLGEWIIVDSCVTPDQKPAPLKYLIDIGVNPADAVRYVVATHWHDDHVKGLGAVLRACSNATLATSSAIRTEQFAALLASYKERLLLDESGIKEWVDILNFMEQRALDGKGPAIPTWFALGERRLYQREAPSVTDVQSCEVWALSPSDESFQKSIEAFGSLFPEPDTTKKRLKSLKPNHTSVVLLIRCGATSMLLGADLEETGSDNAGWKVIAASTARPNWKANLFKIPHHGSSNGHNADVWDKMLVPRPIGILTPWTLAGNFLPQPADEDRLRSLTDSVHITAPAGARPKRIKKSDTAAKMISEATLSFSSGPPPFGHLRLRAKSGAPWNIESFGSAAQL